MPNLNHLTLMIFSPCITENFYMRLLKKILLKNKMNSLVYSVLSKNSNSSILTKNEVDNMFPGIKIGDIYTFFVRKFI